MGKGRGEGIYCRPEMFDALDKLKSQKEHVKRPTRQTELIPANVIFYHDKLTLRSRSNG